MQTSRRTAVNAPGSTEVRRKCERTVGFSSSVRVMDLWVDGVGRTQQIISTNILPSRMSVHPAIFNHECFHRNSLDSPKPAQLCCETFHCEVSFYFCTSPRRAGDISLKRLSQRGPPPRALPPHHILFLRVNAREEIHLHHRNKICIY